MWFLACVVALFALRGPLPGTAADEFQRRLAELGSDRSGERDAAERWLSGHICAERFTDLAAAARDGDAEVRLRLARALGADERHLEVALRFLAESEPALAAIGREAVHASVVGFDRRLGEPGVRGRALAEGLRALAEKSAPRLFRVDPSRPLEQTLRALASFGDVPLGLVVDAGIAERGLRRRAEPIVGSWNEVLDRLADAQGVAIEAHGGNPEGGPRFLRFTARRDDGGQAGVDLVVDWLTTVAAGGTAPERALAARNLIASGFLPGQDWLEALYRTRADEVALEGLVLAAAWGRVSPVLRDARVLLAMLERLPSAPEPQAIAWLQGLAHVGCTTTDGASIPALFANGLGAAEPRGRWTRLFLCRELGCRDPVLERAALDVLRSRSEAPAVRRMAFAVLAAAGPSVAIELPERERLDLFLGIEDDDDGDRLALELAALAWTPPDRDARASSGLPPLARRGLLLAWLRASEPDPAARHLRALVGDDGSPLALDSLAQRLRGLALEGSAVLLREVFDRARRDGSLPALDRLALLVGVLPAEEAVRWAAREPARFAGPTADPLLLGALVGAPVQEGVPEAFRDLQGRARTDLLWIAASTAANPPTAERAGALLAGLELALWGALEEDRDDEGRAFARSVQSALQPGSRSELSRAFTALLRHPPGVPVLDLETEGTGGTGGPGGPGRYRLPASLR